MSKKREPSSPVQSSSGAKEYASTLPIPASPSPTKKWKERWKMRENMVANTNVKFSRKNIPSARSNPPEQIQSQNPSPGPNQDGQPKPKPKPHLRPALHRRAIRTRQHRSVPAHHASQSKLPLQQPLPLPPRQFPRCSSRCQDDNHISLHFHFPFHFRVHHVAVPIRARSRRSYQVLFRTGRGRGV